MPDPASSPIQPESLDRAPLSASQLSLWMLHQVLPAQPAYIIAYIFRLSGPLDITALERSLVYLLQRHASLRTVIRSENGLPYQQVLPPSPITLAVESCEAVPTEQVEEHAAKLARQDTLVPFELEGGRLWRAKLLSYAQEEHVLLFTVHHLIFDAGSRLVFFPELRQAYTAFVGGEIPNLPAPLLQYKDYALAQAAWSQSEAHDEALKYWKSQLENAPEALHLPLDFPRPPQQTFIAQVCRQTLSGERLHALDRFCDDHGVTTFTALMAACAALFYHYSRQESFLLGVPFANRPQPELRQVVGFFVNTLPLRFELARDLSFADLVAKTHETLQGAKEHQTLPFSELLAALDARPDLSQNPLFQVTLNFLHNPLMEAAAPGRLAINFIDYDSNRGAYDLEVLFRMSPEELAIRFVFNRDLFRQDMMEVMLAHLLNLLEHALAEPATPVSQLRLMSAAEQKQALCEWNELPTPAGAEGKGSVCLYRAFEEHAAQAPERIALVADEQQVTYQQLNKKANRLAHYLRSLSMGPGKATAVIGEVTPAFIAAFLAVMKAGSAVMPIPANYPPERIHFMLADSGARLVLTPNLPPSGLVDLAVPVIALDSLDLSNYPDSNLASGPAWEDIALIFYTSGSSGAPKGVLVKHCGLPRLVLKPNYIQITPSDVIGQLANPGFDAFTFEMWAALANGARLALLPKPNSLAPAGLNAAIQRYHISVLFLTTSLFNLVAQEKPETFRSLRYLLFGGEKTDRWAVQRVLEHGKPRFLLNMYGPTETATFATYYPIESLPEGGAAIPIGKPVSATQVYILDAALRPVGIGVPGEIVIGGLGVGGGYLNQPELTAQKFVPVSFQGEKLYLSGDLGRWLPDGNIEYLGRLDQQIKLRGFLIEPGEIETALKHHPAVKEAVVVLQETSQDKRLAAFWSARDATQPDPDLNRHLQSRLPAYMLPAVYEKLGTFPTTPSGKINRLALSRRIADLSPQAEYAPPENEIEARLAHLWQELFSIEPIGRQADFFELGGHSLLAARLFARIEQEFGRVYPLNTIFDHSSLAALAGLLVNPEPLPAVEIARMQPLGDKPPLFLIPGIGANLIYLRDLALAFGPQRPVFGLQSPPDWIQRSLRSEDSRGAIPEIAQYFTRQLLDLLPKGPFLLAGHSAGGFIALEIARLLLAQGKPVSFIGLLDTLPPGKPPQATLTERVHIHLTNLRAKRPAEVWQDLVVGLGRRLARSRLPGRQSMVKTLVQDAPLTVAMQVANAFYEPEPLSVPVTIISASERPWWVRWDPMQGWARYLTGPFEIVRISGSHISILQPPRVAETARLIAERLE